MGDGRRLHRASLAPDYFVAGATAEWTLDLSYAVRTLTIEPFGPPY